MTTRQHTRTVYVGGVPVGGGHPVTVQSMTNTDTRNVPATVAQIHALEAAGCEIVRLAIPDEAAAQALSAIKAQLNGPLPLVADVHFDYRLALAAIAHGADGLRINPGNIGGEARVRQVAEAAQRADIPIRVGANGGSLEPALRQKHGGVTAQALCESLLGHVQMLEACGFQDIVLSLKCSDIPLTLEAHRILCQQVNYPLHVGITEAGTPARGRIKSAAGLGALLAMGIGDTVRVSLTGDPVEEVHCAKEILQAMGLRRFGPQVIACPTCGRTKVNLVAMAEKVERFCETLQAPITVAVMGCVVNGTGEAREADFGIALGEGQAALFRKGQIVRKVPAEEAAEALVAEITDALTHKRI